MPTTEELLAPDAGLLYPLQCLLVTARGTVDFDAFTPGPGEITLEDVPAEEVQAYQERTGISIEPGECPPDEDTETTTTTTVGGQVTTTHTVKVVNPDGTVTTTTTTTKPDGTQSVQIDTETGTPARPAGVLIRLTAQNVPFSLTRPLMQLRVGEGVTCLENVTDRYVLRVWNAVVHAPPKRTLYATQRGEEYYTIDLELLVIGGAP